MAVDNGQPVEATYTNSRLVSKTSLTTQTIQGPISQTNATDSTSSLTGALRTAGGLGVALAAWIGGIFRVTNTTASTSTSTGAAVVTGGLGVGGAAHIGGSAVIGGDMQATGAASASNLSGTNTGDVTLANVGAAPNADGASLSGQVLTLQPADASNPGVVTTDAQEFAGDKTFTNNVEITDGLTVQGDLTVNGTLTSVNSETLDVVDANITINNGGNDVTAEGSGITIDRTGTDGSLVYQNSLASKFKAGALGSESEIITASTAQTMSGIKTFSADAIFQAALRTENEINSTSTGSNVTLVPTKTVHVVTNASLVSVREISAQNNQLIVLINRTGNSITIVDDTAGSFTSGILTGTGSNMTMANDSSILIARVEYSGPSHRFHVIGGSGGGGGGLIVNADIDPAAAIDFSKLAALTSANILVGNASNVATAVAVTGDISMTNAGVTAYSGTVPLNKGGTGQTTKAPAFNALSPMTTLGDIIYGAASGSGTRLAGNTTTDKRYLTQQGDGTNSAAPIWTNLPSPTVQRFTSGTGTYNRSAGVLYIRVRMVGGGGGGAGSGTSAGTSAGNGGSTTFGTSLLTAGGGGLGNWMPAAGPGLGGSTTINSPAITNNSGAGNGNSGSGFATSGPQVGGKGGDSCFGGGGVGPGGTNAGSAGLANTGGGGGGAGSGNGGPGAGGGSGGFLEAIIANPSSSYSYAVGAGGTAGGAGPSGAAGGAGGSGYIEVTEYYA